MALLGTLAGLAVCCPAVHLRLRFVSAVELVNDLEREKAVGKQGQLAFRITHVDLVIHHCHIVETGNESWRFRNSLASNSK